MMGPSTCSSRTCCQARLAASLPRRWLLRSDTMVLYMSGYTDDAALRHGVLHEHDAFLEKPFTPAALIRKVGAALHGSKKEAPVGQT